MRSRGFLSFFLLLLAFLYSNLGFCFYLHQHVTPTYSILEPISLTEESSGMESIDCIYVINLDRHPERLAHFMEEFTAKGLRPNRVKGVDSQLLLYSTIKKISGTYPVTMRPGEYGCLLSHLAIYKDAYERGFSRIWILEDGTMIRLDVDVIPSLLASLTSFDPNWDIFYTDIDSRAPKGGYYRPDAIPFRPDQPKMSMAFLSQRKKISENLWRVRSRWGRYSYILSRKGIEKIYNYFAHVYIFSPIDDDLHLIPTIRQYTAAKDIVTNPRLAPISDTEKRSSPR